MARERINRKTAYHHGDLRRTLVLAARRLIETKGPAHLSLRGAARLAGVSAAAPYRHFADKSALLAAVLQEGFAQLAKELAGARARAKGPVPALVAVGNQYVRFAEANTSVYRLMFGPTLDKAQHPELQAAGLSALGELLGAVTVCHEAGLLEKNVEVHELALGGWALCHGLASLHVDGALGQTLPVDVHAVGDTLIHFMLNGALKSSRR
ncbi:MAG: TetR/AcrR family transcriptional regulator [Myxococcaceae bacterium]|nr:TetR/AcrR family transcriptional regulator [Myxococcaceae bacterium]